VEANNFLFIYWVEHVKQWERSKQETKTSEQIQVPVKNKIMQSTSPCKAQVQAKRKSKQSLCIGKYTRHQCK